MTIIQLHCCLNVQSPCAGVDAFSAGEVQGGAVLLSFCYQGVVSSVVS